MILSRRRLLTALGLSAASPLLGSFAPFGRAQAGPALAPRRLVILSTNHGAWYPDWAMRPGALPEDAEWQAPLGELDASAFSPSLAPLHPFRDRLNILDGLALSTAELDLSSFRHDKGRLHMWTGLDAQAVGGTVLAGGPSLDQAIAAVIARPDRLPSLALAVGAKKKAISFAGAQHPLPYEGDPRAVYQRLFGLAEAGDPAAADLSAQASVLDFVQGEYEALLPRLGGAERLRLEQHRDLVRGLELRLDGMATANCGAPPVPGASPSNPSDAYLSDWEAQVELIAAAFSCDLTRVVSVTFDDIPGALLGVPGAAVHEEHAHAVWSSPASAGVMVDYAALHATQLATLLAALDALPEGEGSVLDSTLVVWGNEMGDGAHGFDRLPVVLAGGSWAFPTGRYLHWPRQIDRPLWGATGLVPLTGVPHQHLLVSVAQAFGLPVDTFGRSELPLGGGGVRSLSGGLDALLGP